MHLIYTFFFLRQVPVLVCDGCWLVLSAAPLLLCTPGAGEEARWGRRNISHSHCHFHHLHQHFISCTSKIEKEGTRVHTHYHYHHYPISVYIRLMGQVSRDTKSNCSENSCYRISSLGFTGFIITLIAALKLNSFIKICVYLTVFSLVTHCRKFSNELQCQENFRLWIGICWFSLVVFE